MNRPANSAFLALTVLLSVYTQIDDPKCSRSLDAVIQYSKPPSDNVPVEDAGIIDFVNDGERNLLTIVHPSVPREPYLGFRNYQELTSSDDGKTWTNRTPLNEIGSTLAVRLNDFWQAPSDPKVQYRFDDGLGTVLRSDDLGTRWLLPDHRIDGVSKDEFVRREGGSGFYTAQFHIAAVDPHNPLKIYASISIVPWASIIYREGDLYPHDLGGLYVSDDGGNSWHLFSDVLVNRSPLGVSPRHENIMYGLTADGVVKSTDAGKIWKAIGQQTAMAARAHTPPNQASKRLLDPFEVNQFLFDPAQDDSVYIISTKGVYRTTDGGEHWRLLNLGFDEFGSVHSMALAPKNSQELVIGTTHGVLVSRDGGCHFRRAYP